MDGIQVPELLAYLTQGLTLRDIAELYGVEMVVIKGYVKTSLEEYIAAQGASDTNTTEPIHETPEIVVPEITVPEMVTPDLAQ